MLKIMYRSDIFVPIFLSLRCFGQMCVVSNLPSPPFSVKSKSSLDGKKAVAAKFNFIPAALFVI